MKRHVATFLMSFLCMRALLSGYSLEMNASYDYFRDIPDGSWNGNNGALIAANSSFSFYDYATLQAGGSYGLYNWDGRGNLVFANPKKLQQIAFVTAGAASSFNCWNAGVVYDRLFTRHYSLVDQSPSIDQLRFQIGYVWCFEEFGFWGTYGLETAHKNAFGIPVNFKAISQANLFWTHYFANAAQTTVWIGMPYRHSLMFPNGKAGNLITGFSIRVPLTDRLFLDGNGSYMFARSSPGVTQSNNYHANISIGITFNFTSCCDWCESAYMSIANHSNFFLDTDINQFSVN